MAESFLKGLLEKSEEVPTKIVRLNDEIRDLDEEVFDMMATVQEKTLLYLKNQNKFPREVKAKAYKEIQVIVKEAEEKSAKKVELAKEMYNFIDTRIQELDDKTNEFNRTMSRKNMNEQKKINGAVGGGRTDKKKKKNDEGKGNRLAETEEFSNDFKPIQLQPFEMPVNPNEPRYCICHQVSFGQMIGCDNPTCKYEWFHIQCIKLDHVPEGDWVCDYCKAKQKKK